MLPPNTYPEGLRPGDFIQTDMHFGDIFCEVKDCWESGKFWMITYYYYDKYGCTPKTRSVNSSSSIRRVLPAEMALPVIQKKRHRCYSKAGRYDPITGFVPSL